MATQQQIALERLETITRDLRSSRVSDDVRKRAALQLRELVLVCHRDLQPDHFNNIYHAVNTRITQLIAHGSDSAERLGGVYALDSIVDIDATDQATKYARFLQNLKAILRGKDMSPMQAAAVTLGKMCRPGGSVISELVESETQFALEWLQNERVEERRYSAALVLRELARQAPTLMYNYVGLVLDLIWNSLRDSRQLIRSTSADTIAACFRIIRERDQEMKQAWMEKAYSELLRGLQNGSVEYIHASLLMLKELLEQGGMFMQDHYPEACEIVLRMGLAEKSLKQLIGTESSLTSMIPYWNDRPQQPNVGLPRNVPSQIIYAMLKFEWEVGQQPANKTSGISEKTLYCLRKFTNDSAHRHEVTKAHLTAQGQQGVDMSQEYNFPQGMEGGIMAPQTQRALQDQTVLLAKCYLRQGEWLIALNKETWQYENVQDILTAYSQAAKYNPRWYKAWHAWALANFEIVQALTSRSELNRADQAMIVDHVVPAVRGFFKSIALSSGSSLQDTLRLLTLWFTHGSSADVNAAVTEGFTNVSVDTWLEVIPQLIARINQQSRRVQQTIHSLLADVGRAHPQALIYPLTVATKSWHSARRSRSAAQIMDSMRQHSANLVSQADVVSNELIRVAVLWHEQWHEGLEEASRLYFGDHNIEGMFSTLEPLHDQLERGPETLREISFAQTFGRDLTEAREWCRQYESSRDVNDLNQAWDLYYQVFRRISRQLPQLTSLELPYCSPKLLGAKDLDLAVPGTYRSGKPIVRIMDFEGTFSVINSKQRPRKITIGGSDGVRYAFLELIQNIENAIKSENVPPDLLGLLLNLAEFMEHDDKALPIDIRVLGHQAGRCHAYAKALHYKELEFLQDQSSGAVEALIGINNHLQQSDAAIGILRKAQLYKEGIQLRETWFEKLERWEEALDFYNKREQDIPEDQAVPVDIIMGKMRCLHALGEWEALANIAGNTWSNSSPEVQRLIAPLATAAAWGLSKWDSMDNYLQSMKRFSTDRSFFGAILALHRNQFREALNCVQQTREGLDTELSALVSESYNRAYTVVVRVQMLAELEELIFYKQTDEKKRAAMVHIIQGRAILAKLAEDPQEAQGPAADLIRRELVPVYTRLSVASFVFGAKPVPIPTELRPQRPTNIVFDRLEDAELSLHEIIDDGLRFAKDAKAWVFTADPTSLNWAAEIKAWRARSAELTRRSDQWQVAFAVLIAAQGGGSTGAARMCRLYYLTLTVYLGTALTRLECSFDEHMTTFASIVDVAGEILQDEEARGAAAPDSDGARFSFESGIVPPLYYTAVKCRHPELRRAAIRLLRRKGALDCKENLWDARLVARIAMRIVELEETRALKILGKGVPEPDSRHAKAYIPARDEIQNFLKSIPGNRPPSIPHEEAEWIFEAEAAGPVPEGDVVDALGLPDDDDARSSPFLVPEAARVMNADISPRVSGGSWVTFWVVPQMEGEQRWDVIREFVARGTQKSPILNRV
ncbi:hypothetical protein BN1723_003772 [Verticillium longisporum]|uniref:non-specific serine/threonine protein kinase n=1 Tax=Verticillium longisporum TaxID=100787 RepID=A0A0G4M9T6_VERLO|nr:hypothetical protein BN1723_003772 [Verticillium longisporum]